MNCRLSFPSFNIVVEADIEESAKKTVVLMPHNDFFLCADTYFEFGGRKLPLLGRKDGANIYLELRDMINFMRGEGFRFSKLASSLIKPCGLCEWMDEFSIRNARNELTAFDLEVFDEVGEHLWLAAPLGHIGVYAFGNKSIIEASSYSPENFETLISVCAEFEIDAICTQLCGFLDKVSGEVRLKSQQ